ncbi:MAG: hypothetical protein NZ870_00710 [bacterium]|nr:hypothetical protein [bacterium]
MLLILSILFSIPPYRVFFEAKYGYDVSCGLCHHSDDWSINSYGKDFYKYGLSLEALSKIEALDSDKDGYSNIVEIKSKSNPASSYSTPKNIGFWLDEIPPIKAPVKILNRFFKNVEYEVIKKHMSEIEIENFKKINGRDPDDYEKYNVVFSAKKGDNIKGFSSYIVFFKNKDLNIVLGVFSTNGEVIYLHPVHIHSKDVKRLLEKDYKKIPELNQKLQGIISSCKIKLGLN